MGGRFDPAYGWVEDEPDPNEGLYVPFPEQPPPTTPVTSWDEPTPLPAAPSPAPAPSPQASPSAPSSGGGGDNPYTPSSGGSGYGTPSSFQVSGSWPGFTAPPLPTIDPMAAPPPFSFDAYQAPQDFSYENFSAPSMDQAAAEPGYEFARREGQRALENSASARGITRTGGTLKDFIGWGNKFAEQNYGNVYNREANTYGMNRGNAFQNWGANETARAQAYDRNRGNAFDAYKTNYDVNRDVYGTNKGTALDLYDRAYQGAQGEYLSKYNPAALTFQDIYQRDRDKLNSLTGIATAGAGI